MHPTNMGRLKHRENISIPITAAALPALIISNCDGHNTGALEAEAKDMPARTMPNLSTLMASKKANMTSNRKQEAALAPKLATDKN